MSQMSIDELLANKDFRFYCGMVGFDIEKAIACQARLKDAIVANDDGLIDEIWKEWKSLRDGNDDFKYCVSLTYNSI